MEDSLPHPLSRKDSGVGIRLPVQRRPGSVLAAACDLGCVRACVCGCARVCVCVISPAL